MIHIIAFSSKGCELALKISEGLEEENIVFSKTTGNSEGTIPVDMPLSRWARSSFLEANGIIFVGATGIAVRAIAPHVKNKAKDPAVVCIDELGKFSISLLSGHLGGANNLARKVSTITGAVPVISTATDLNKKFSVDTFASTKNMVISDMVIAKEISAAVLENKKIGFKSDYPYSGKLPENLTESQEEYGIYVTSSNKSVFEKTLRLIPKNLILGIGCRRDTSKDTIDSVVRKVLSDNDISIEGVRLIASIDLKSDEKGILEFSDSLDVPFVFFPAKKLNTLRGTFSKSDFVLKTTGVDCVSERAAMLPSAKGELIIRKTGLDGVTVAVVRESYRFNFGVEPI